MALKGFLASGFQKLIGASRILGANNRYVGEHNAQNYTGDFPITTTLNAGFNVIRYTGTTSRSYISGALFSSNPTSPTQVLLINTTGFSVYLGNNPVVSGGLLVSNNAVTLLSGESVLLVYDQTADYWRELGQNSASPFYGTFSISNTDTVLAITSYFRRQVLTINTSTLSDRTLTSLVFFSAGNALPSGMQITLIGAADLPLTYQITLQQFTGIVGPAFYERFLINGDFVFTRNSSITLISTPNGWVEIGRSTPTYGA